MHRPSLGFRLDGFWRVALLVLVLRGLSGGTALLAYLVIIVYGIRGPRQAIEAFMLSWFLTMANPDIFGQTAGSSVGRLAALLIVSGSVLLRTAMRSLTGTSHAVMATFIFGSYMILHSFLVSPMVLVSLLKGLTWTLAMLSIALSFTVLSKERFECFEKHAYGFLVLILLLCIPTYLMFPGAQMRGYGFLRGMLGHSQATGALAALMAIWAFSRILDKPKRTTMDFVIFGTGFTTAFMSGTRTAVIAIMISMVAVLLVAGLRNRRPFQRLSRALSSPLVAVGAFILLMFAIINSDRIVTSFDEFLNKNSGAETLVAAYESSRGALIDRMFENIADDPIVGIGFGMASDLETMVIERVAGIPVSAVVEKGVAHIAIWEELGIIGLILYLYWVIVVFSKGFSAEVAQFGLLMVIFLLNFGDAYIFSAGGMGLLLLVLIGYASKRTGRSPLPDQGPVLAFEQRETAGYARRGP